MPAVSLVVEVEPAPVLSSSLGMETVHTSKKRLSTTWAEAVIFPGEGSISPASP